MLVTKFVQRCCHVWAMFDAKKWYPFYCAASIALGEHEAGQRRGWI